jgi:predicted polyphosphate/ATP-dependent NAD kinase
LSAKPEQETPAKTLGLIVNPVAGMGGAVGLKGTDGDAVLKQAVTLGAKPIAPKRAEVFLSALKPANTKIRLVVGAVDMGEEVAAKCGFAYTVLGKRKKVTTAEDTRETARNIAAEKANLLVFCGGDGTARNILEAIGTDVPVLGVPTGVKMHSSVFAVNPTAAAKITVGFLLGELPLRETEVMDVDETAFRAGRVSSKLYGYVLTPYEPHLIQGAKMASPMTESELRSQAAIAIYMIENMKPEVRYIVGPGTTTRIIGDLLDAKKTLLGVDLFCNKKIVASDVNEKQILAAIKGKPTQIIVTPIGGQGFVFGRGNQQISSEVIRRVGLGNIIVVATTSKLQSLQSLKVDTGDPSLDEEFRARGVKVVADYKVEYRVRLE